MKIWVNKTFSSAMQTIQVLNSVHLQISKAVLILK